MCRRSAACRWRRRIPRLVRVIVHMRLFCETALSMDVHIYMLLSLLFLSVTSVKLTPCGRFCVSGSYDFSTRVWDTITRSCLFTLGMHSAGTRAHVCVCVSVCVSVSVCVCVCVRERERGRVYVLVRSICVSSASLYTLHLSLTHSHTLLYYTALLYYALLHYQVFGVWTSR
jgi:WD40 repeat protein